MVPGLAKIAVCSADPYSPMICRAFSNKANCCSSGNCSGWISWNLLPVEQATDLVAGAGSGQEDTLHAISDRWFGVTLPNQRSKKVYGLPEQW